MKSKKNRSNISCHRFERALLSILFFFLFGAVAVYMYFISMTVIQVALRQELIVAIQEKQLQVSQLEVVYFEKINTLSRDSATNLGLVAIEPTAYVSVTPKGGYLTRSE